MTNWNGGFRSYPNRPTIASLRTFFGAEGYSTKPLTIKAGQILKKHSFVETDASGLGVAHSGMCEKALLTFSAGVAAAKTIIIAGLTFTTTGIMSAADVVKAFSGLTDGITAADANAANPVVGGSFTAGALTGYHTFKSSTTNSVLFVSTSANTNVADLADAGNSTVTSVTITAFPNPQKKIAGVLLMDVDASAGDVDTTVYTEASFWANAIVWEADASDTIEMPDGSTKACTDYVVGAFTDALKRKFVEGTEFEEIGILHAGEDYV